MRSFRYSFILSMVSLGTKSSFSLASFIISVMVSRASVRFCGVGTSNLFLFSISQSSYIMDSALDMSSCSSEAERFSIALLKASSISSAESENFIVSMISMISSLGRLIGILSKIDIQTALNVSSSISFSLS